MPMPAGGPPPPPPGAGGAPAGPQPAPMGMDKPQLSGVAQNIQDPTQRAKANLQAVARDIAMANPGKTWKPTELLDTIDEYVKTLSAFSDSDKLYMQALIAQGREQNQLLMTQMRDQTSMANTEQRVGATERGQDMRAQTAHESLAERIRSDSFQHEDRSQRNSVYAQAAANSHEDRQAAIQAANDRNDAQLAEKLTALDKAIEDKDWATVANIQAGEYKAEVANAPVGKPPPKPAITPKLRQPLGGGAKPAEKPPVTGARKAPDGKWYVSDPKRPGKYLLVQ